MRGWGPEPATARRPEPSQLTTDDLLVIAASFDARSPDSNWCGYGSCLRENGVRAVLFAANNPLAITLIHRSDEGYSLDDVAGQDICNADTLTELLDSYQNRCRG